MSLFANIISPYFLLITEKEISISFLVYSLMVPAVLAVAFGAFLYLKTKKLSALYLFLLCSVFSIYAFLDLVSWFPNAQISTFSWSILDVFDTSFFILSYWFLYSFVKEHDLPLWQKVLTGSTLIPILAITAFSINMNAFTASLAIGIENQAVTNYNSVLLLLFVLLTIVFSAVEYFKATDPLSKKKIALAGTGVAAFLFIFTIILVVVNLIISTNLWGLAANSYVYNIDLYSLFGMPILLAFLGYLIAKYQAFNMKLIKSVAYMVLLMVILFIGLFFA